MMPALPDRVFVVTGASAGLGRAIAAALVAAGGKVVLAARGEESLLALAAELGGPDKHVLAVPTDVTSDEHVAVLMNRAVERFGRIDGLVNNVGVSMRSALLDTSPDDFRHSLELNLLAAVRCTRAAAPHIIAQRGHIVNIGSLAGKSASRFLGAYPAAKHALSAYTQQLRLELADQGVHVLLVCPGPIAREQVRTYAAEQQKNLPDSARRPGGGVRTKAIAPDRLAEKIVAAIVRRQPELIVPAKARLLFALQQLSPSLGDWLVRKMTSK
ncbi:MAG: SDR family NAD(P)-dependent oxidoreductase [Pirellulales bacterium]